MSPARPTNCEECRTIAEWNNDKTDCIRCSKPQKCSLKNARAWEVWSILDGIGRDYDTVAGNPLPLRLEALNLACSKDEDPDGLRWRILEIEKRILQKRRELKK